MISSLSAAEGFHSFFAISEQPTTQEMPPANVSTKRVLDRVDRGFRLHRGAVGWGLLGGEIPLTCILFSSARSLDLSLALAGVRALRLAPVAARAVAVPHLAASFVVGVGFGIGINYLPLAFGAERTVGDYLGDAAIDIFGPADQQGNLFKVCEFLGLA